MKVEGKVIVHALVNSTGKPEVVSWEELRSGCVGSAFHFGGGPA